MHQDQRIGLALGVLLVGASAAFFFRNEAKSVAPVPRLRHAQELDDRIAERSMRPYLKGVEAVEAADRRRSRSSPDQEAPDCDHTSSEWSSLEPLGIQVASEDSFQNRKPRAKPLDDDREIQELAPIAIPSDSRVSWDDSIDGKAESKHQRPNPKTTPTEGRFHVVQKGDSLSSIAARTLGSPNRFHDIFEANQDQLRDPNDLKLGMTLRIPDQRHGSNSKSEHGNPDSSVDQEAVNFDTPAQNLSNDPSSNAMELRAPDARPLIPDSPSDLIPPALPSDSLIDSPSEPWSSDDASTNSTKKFVPSRRTPPPTRPIGPQAKNLPPRETSGRRLSQASLESTSGKVAR